jgi:hypothetical protein
MNNQSLAPAAVTVVLTGYDIDEPRSGIIGLSLLLACLKFFSFGVHCDVCHKAWKREKRNEVRKHHRTDCFLRREADKWFVR